MPTRPSPWREGADGVVMGFVQVLRSRPLFAATQQSMAERVGYLAPFPRVLDSIPSGIGWRYAQTLDFPPDGAAGPRRPKAALGGRASAGRQRSVQDDVVAAFPGILALTRVQGCRDDSSDCIRQVHRRLCVPSGRPPPARLPPSRLSADSVVVLRIRWPAARKVRDPPPRRSKNRPSQAAPHPSAAGRRLPRATGASRVPASCSRPLRPAGRP